MLLFARHVVHIRKLHFWPYLWGMNFLCRTAQNEELRQIKRQTGTSGQQVLDLRERLNFQRFKYELLVDMVRLSIQSQCA